MMLRIFRRVAIGLVLAGGLTLGTMTIASAATTHVATGIRAQSPPPGPIQLPFQPHPDPKQLPGSDAAQNLVDGFEAWAFIGCLAGGIAGAATMGIAGVSRHIEAGKIGRAMVFYAAIGVLLIAAMYAILNFFMGIGSKI